MRGLPKAIIKKYGVSKKAWAVFRSGKKHSRVSTVTKIKKRSGGRMARRRSRARGITIPIAPIAGLIAAPNVTGAITEAMKGNFDGVAKNLGCVIGVYEGKFNFNILLNNLTPIAVGLLVHKFVGGSPLNMNRTLARANVPFIRI